MLLVFVLLSMQQPPNDDWNNMVMFNLNFYCCYCSLVVVWLIFFLLFSRSLHFFYFVECKHTNTSKTHSYLSNKRMTILKFSFLYVTAKRIDCLPCALSAVLQHTINGYECTAYMICMNIE